MPFVSMLFVLLNWQMADIRVNGQKMVEVVLDLEMPLSPFAPSSLTQSSANTFTGCGPRY